MIRNSEQGFVFQNKTRFLLIVLSVMFTVVSAQTPQILLNKQMVEPELQQIYTVHAGELTTVSAAHSFQSVNNGLDALNSPDTLKLSYCSDTLFSMIGIGANTTIKCGAFLPANSMKPFVGNQIKAIRIGSGLGDLLNAKIFLSVDKDSVPFYTQDITLSNLKWNNIQLTTPYNITGSGLFVGYQVRTGAANYYPLGVDKGPGHGDASWIKTISSIGTISDWFPLIKSNNINISLQIVLQGNNLPEACLNLTDFSVPDYIRPNSKYEIFASLKNLGTDTVSELKCQLRYGNNILDTLLITGLNIRPNQLGNFNAESMSPSLVGEDSLYLNIIQVNGKNNVIAYDFGKKISISDQFYPKNIVLEHFSTAECVYCPGGHDRVNQVLATRPNVFELVHHAGYSVDPLTISESSSYLWFYTNHSSGGTFAPGIMLNRTNKYNRLAEVSAPNSPVMSVGSVLQIEKLVDEELAQPAFVNVNIDNRFNLDNRQLTVNIYGNKLKDLTRSTGQLPKLFVFLVEDSIIMYQKSLTTTIPDYVHLNAVRDLISNVLWGSGVTFQSDGSYFSTFNYNVPEGWNENHLKLVAFMGYTKVTDPNQCEILNSDSKVLNFIRTDIQTPHKSIGLNVNGHQVTLPATSLGVSVYDLTGKRVLETTASSFVLPNTGIYMVRMLSEGKELTQKILIR